MDKKSVLKKIIGSIVAIVVTVIFVQILGHLLDPFEAQDGLDAVDAFHSLEDNSVDVMVFGSSRAWKGCDTRVMQDEYGISAYNYGCNWQALNTTQLFLEDALRTQSPKVVCIEMGHVGLIEEDTDLDGQIYYTKNIKNSEAKKKYLKRCFGNNIGRYISYYFPLVMFHDNWTEIDFENFYSVGKETYIASRGYNTDNNETSEPSEFPDYYAMDQQELSAESKVILDEMVELCKERGIEVILFTNPVIDEYHYTDALEEYSIDNGIEYIGMNEVVNESSLDASTDMQDYLHLNQSGAKKVARYLAEFVIDNNLLH